MQPLFTSLGQLCMAANKKRLSINVLTWFAVGFCGSALQHQGFGLAVGWGGVFAFCAFINFIQLPVGD